MFNNFKVLIMAKQKGTKPSMEVKVVGEALRNRHVNLDDIHSDIWEISKRIGENPVKVGKFIHESMMYAVEQTFAQDFSKKPNRQHHRHGH